MIICPICHHLMIKNMHQFQCVNKHAFDIAKSGYVNLWPGSHKGSGDDKEMVQARTNFLQANHYQIFQSKLLEMIHALHPSTILDVGCGEGYYTNAIQKENEDCSVYGLDVSKSALIHASKQNYKVQYILATLANIPLEDHAIDVISDVFAPIDEQSFHRVLKPGGYLIKVGPGKKHLWEMKQQLYPNVYENDDAIIDYNGFKHLRREVVNQSILLSSQAEIKALFQMTPYYWKSPKDTSQKLMEMDTLEVEVSFCFDLYQSESL